MKAMTTNKKNEIHVKPLLPLEYCSVDRAARLLGCEVGDILHWMEIKAVNAYFRFDQSDFDKDGNEKNYTLKGYGTGIVEPEISEEALEWMERHYAHDQNEIEQSRAYLEPEEYLESEPDESITAEMLTELEYMEDSDEIAHGLDLIKTSYCSYLMHSEVLVPERNNRNSNILLASGVPKGIWEITNGYKFWGQLLHSPDDGVEGVLLRPTPYDSEGAKWVLEYHHKMFLSDVVLIREDLVKLHRSIQLGADTEVLPNYINNKEVAKEQRELEKYNENQSGKISIGKKYPKQAHMINALIDSIPSLRERINAVSETKAHDVIIDYFEKHDVDFPEIDESTFRGWLKLGRY
ncbi:hypothetical protein [Vibrio alginolyticus]|uniref:hypothetical protein n=1 Tax=Vibrio alginolyticus TaxID=663 RepID=UPI00215F728A|nr:hypothetical protein [Vibrio alginolyticus]MCS0292964.1 hypothetical protein [Vibrio alginolyticus]